MAKRIFPQIIVSAYVFYLKSSTDIFIFFFLIFQNLTKKILIIRHDLILQFHVLIYKIEFYSNISQMNMSLVEKEEPYIDS